MWKLASGAPPSDCDVLWDFGTTSSDAASKMGWTADGTDPQWCCHGAAGVTCDETQRVVRLELDKRGITGVCAVRTGLPRLSPTRPPARPQGRCPMRWKGWTV